MRVFLQSISAAAEAPGQGFAAIKVRLLLSDWAHFHYTPCKEQWSSQQGVLGGFLSWEQVTALGNPKLLERVSAGLLAIKNLFNQFDLNHDDVVSREEFSTVSSLAF